MRFMLASLTVSLCAFSAAAEPALERSGLMTWPRAGAREFGCFLEKEFGARDSRFNCALKDYVNAGDPCTNTESYSEGPIFPPSRVSLVHPMIETIELIWQKGKLQAVSVNLKRKTSRAKAMATLKLAPSSENVIDVSVQDCSNKATCVILTGFEHMGAGDVTCE